MRKTAILKIEENGVAFALILEGLRESSILGHGQISGNILDDAATITAKLSAELERFRSGGLRIALLLPRRLARVIQLKIPAKDKETVAKMMQYEVARQFPLPAGQVLYDYKIEGKSGNDFLITLCGIKKDDFNLYYNLLASHGITAEIVSIPTGGWLKGSGKRTHIELSAEGLEFTLLDGNIPLYSRWASINPRQPYHGNMIEKEIEQARLASSVSGIEAHLENISISGEGRRQTALELASLPKLSSTTITTLPENSEKSGKDRLLTTIGLAGVETAGFNLLPEELKPAFWSGEKAKVGFAAIGLLLLIAVWGISSIAMQKQEVNSLREELTLLRSEASEAELMVIKSDEMEAHFNGYAAFDERAEFTITLLGRLTSLLPKNTHLTDIEMRGKSLIISGISSDSSSLVNILEQSQEFTAVKIIGAVRAAIDNKEKFKVGMELE